MSIEHQRLIHWACDACGSVETLDIGGGTTKPKGWSQFLSAPLSASLGNVSAKHLCKGCTEVVGYVLNDSIDRRIEGDQAEAWRRGVETALQHAIRQPDGITLRLNVDNPYREYAEEPT